MRAITGIGASDGLVIGTVRRLRHTQAALGRSVMDPRQEEETYRAAAQRAKQQLEKLEQKAEPEDRAILSAQRAMLDDPDLEKEILGYLRAGAGAAAAVERAAGIYAGRIRALDDPYLRERACDVLDACYRVVGVLDDQPHTTVDLSCPAIIAAEELYPTDILTLDRSMILGIVTGAGSPNAHACFIARTMGIPAVVMAGQEFVEACEGKIAAVDGGSGEVYLDPDVYKRQVYRYFCIYFHLLDFLKDGTYHGTRSRRKAGEGCATIFISVCRSNFFSAFFSRSFCRRERCSCSRTFITCLLYTSRCV